MNSHFSSEVKIPQIYPLDSPEESSQSSKPPKLEDSLWTPEVINA